MHWLLSLILVAGFVQTESTSTLVTGLWGQYREQLVRHDAEALAGIFTENARFMEAQADDLVGRQTIQARFERVFALRVRPVDLRITPREVARFGGRIYDQGDTIQTLALAGDPKRAYDVYGRYYAVWAEQPEGGWKLARLMVAPKAQPKR